MVQRIGILGGTFDPPHRGHLLMAEEARLKLKLDEIWWMPNHIPPHKTLSQGSTTEDRKRMVTMMVACSESFKFCDIEIIRDGPSYTVDTLKELVTNYPDKEFFFIMGEDSLMSFKTWQGWRNIEDMVSLIVIARPGFEVDISSYHSAAIIHLLNDISLDVSSSYIRDQCKMKELNRFLLSTDVYRYMKENHLYE